MLCSARDDDEDVFAAMLRDKKVIAARAAAGESPFLEIVVLDWTPWSRESSGQKIVVAAKYVCTAQHSGASVLWWWDAMLMPLLLLKNPLFCPSRPSEKDWKNEVHLLLYWRENNLLSIGEEGVNLSKFIVFENQFRKVSFKKTLRAKRARFTLNLKIP